MNASLGCLYKVLTSKYSSGIVIGALSLVVGGLCQISPNELFTFFMVVLVKLAFQCLQSLHSISRLQQRRWCNGIVAVSHHVTSIFEASVETSDVL